jgi:hypothetical protein
MNDKVYQATEKKFNYDDLVSGKDITLKVRAISDTYKGPWTEVINTKVLMKSPTNISVEKEGNNVKIDWNDVIDAEMYLVEVNGERIALTDKSEYIMENPEINKLYLIRVRTQNGEKFSKWSDVNSYMNADASFTGIVLNQTGFEYNDKGEPIVEITVRAQNCNKLYSDSFELDYDTRKLNIIDENVQFINVSEGEYNKYLHNKEKGNLRFIHSKIKDSEGMTGNCDIVKFKCKPLYGLASEVNITEAKAVNSNLILNENLSHVPLKLKILK